jgi:hypothetical protein
VLVSWGIDEECENEPERLDKMHSTRYTPCENREIALLRVGFQSKENACMDHLSSFKTGWFMGNLPGYRVSEPGWNPASCEHLPPIDETHLDGTLQWLELAWQTRFPAISGERRTLGDLVPWLVDLEELVFSAEKLGLSVNPKIR